MSGQSPAAITTHGHHPPTIRHIDFTAIRRQKSPLVARNNKTVLSQQENIHLDNHLVEQVFDKEEHTLALQMDAQRIQLISPPPEEFLSLMWASSSRTNTNSTPATLGTTTTAGNLSKRKRAPPTPAKRTIEDKMPEITPNPKPRKQRHVRVPSAESPTRPQALTTPTKSKKKVIIQSPHLKNPDADYIPPLVLPADQERGLSRTLVVPSTKSRSRKSTTPIPPYEPPPDIFTPPRVVFMTPATASTRSAAPKRKGSVGRQTKMKGKGKVLRVNTNMQVKQEIPDDIDLLAPMPPPSPTDDPLLLSGPPEPEPVRACLSFGGEEERLPPSSPMRACSSFVGEEERELPPSSPVLACLSFVGKEKELPPSSPVVVVSDECARRDGSEDLDSSMIPLDDADVEAVRSFDFGGGGWSDSDDGEEGEGEFTGRWRMMKVPMKQDPPSSATRLRQERWGRPISPFPKRETLALVGEEEEEEEEEEVRMVSIEPQQGDMRTVFIEREEMRTVSAEREEVRTVSVEPQEEEMRTVSVEREEVSTIWDEGEEVASVQRGNVPAVEDSRDEESSDTDDEDGLVKITSADPRAAARAVAILQKHDYDCYTKLIKKRRASHSAVVDLAKESRRRDVTSAGILKSTDRRRRRRSTMGVIGDKVIIPGSPIVTLPELLQQAEEEITQSSVRSPRPERDPFMTPISVKSINKWESTITTPKRYTAGPREWTRDDWKLLDACFTDQRINPCETLAPVEAVSLEGVVARFVDTMGGQSLVDTFGDAWTRDNLLERTRALLKKQRSGSVAPPTTPMSSPMPFPTSGDTTSNKLGNRFRGFFASYLPMLSRQSSSSKRPVVQDQPGLPLPPQSILEKPRGPVATPARPFVPRAPPAKDLVHLNHVLLPPSNIPRAKSVPKRLVELVPVPQPASKTVRDGVVPRPRRSSGSSVRDLVKGFEQMEKSVEGRRFGNTRNLKQGKADMRPIWKP